MSKYYDVLSHHGVKGMHWGVRRYQNEDGSYINSKAQKRAERIAAKRENKAVRKSTKNEYKNSYRNSKSMSDEELRARTNRLNLERNYRSAVANSYHDSLSTGRQVVNKKINFVADKSVNAMSSQSVIKGSRTAGEILYDKGSTKIDDFKHKYKVYKRAKHIATLAGA